MKNVKSTLIVLFLMAAVVIVYLAELLIDGLLRFTSKRYREKGAMNSPAFTLLSI